VDAAGNESEKSSQACATTYDITPPEVVITSPPSPHSTTLNPITISGTASDTSGVTAVEWANNRGGGGTCNGTTDWTCDATLVENGQNRITITARDAAGNAGSGEVVIDYSPPAQDDDDGDDG
jgi:hypothetical protein